MLTIGIIGGGFCGTMTAIQLIEQSSQPLDLRIIFEGESFNRGIAYHPYSDKHLLNVVAERMSAYPDDPNHFLEWAIQQPCYKHQDKTILANSYLPRRHYGEYLQSLWKEAEKKAGSKKIKITLLEGAVVDLALVEGSICLLLTKGRNLRANHSVIASGNSLPANPQISNMGFYAHPLYFQNPWKVAYVENTVDHLPILLLGNGLTMVDTVFGLLENRYKGKIYSISPNGFNILPHRHNGIGYSKLVEERRENMTIHQWVSLVNQHIKSLRGLGISAEPIIDSLRPHTQKIWRSFSPKEKELFLRRLRHLWGVARHRIPLHSHDKIQQLRKEGRLRIGSGKVLDFKEKDSYIEVLYFEKKDNRYKRLDAGRIINCTGPETRLSKLDNSFLTKCLAKGIIEQDPLQLGIKTDIDSFRILDSKENPHPNIYAIGGLLKGELWESTAVSELRVQSKRLAAYLIDNNALKRNNLNNPSP